MMSQTEAKAVVMLAESRSLQQRRHALQMLAQCRLPKGAHTKLSALLADGPQQDISRTPLEHVEPLDADPWLDKNVRAEVDEWCQGWIHEEALLEAGASRPGAMLLYGPPGTGKTITTRAIARWLRHRPAYVLDAHRFVDSHLGESGRNLASAFDACRSSHALLVIEELDVVGQVRGSDKSVSETSRIVAAIMRLLEAAHHPVVATTNRLDTLDPALLRRFDVQLEMDEPPADIRRAILAELLGREPDRYLLDAPLRDAVRWARRERRRDVLAGLVLERRGG